MKRTLLVFPSYTVVGLNERTLHVLRQAGVLPNDLGGYTTNGAAKDDMAMRNIIGTMSEYMTLDGEVTSATFKTALRWLLAHDTTVAFLLFCGHGVFEASPRHGTMVCSFKQFVAAEEVDDIADKQRFRGTFVRIINTCQSGNEPDPSNAYQQQQGASGRAIQRLTNELNTRQVAPQQPVSESSPLAMAPWLGVTVVASSAFGVTSGNSSGSKLVAALKRMFAAELHLTYEGLEATLTKYYPHAHVHLSHPAISGSFGNMATMVGYCQSGIGRDGGLKPPFGRGSSSVVVPVDPVDPVDPDDSDVEFCC
jgi:hypothetical protein